MVGGKLLPWGITTRGGFWATRPLLGRSRMASKSRPPAEAGWGVSGLGGGSGAQPSTPGHSLYWGCSCSGRGCRVRMLQLMPGTGCSSCRQTHRACASWPALGRMATFCMRRSVGASTKRGWWELGRGALPYQRGGAARGGEPGHQDVPFDGEDRPASLWSVCGGAVCVRPVGVTPSPAPAPAWPHCPGTHQPSARSWRPSPCPPQTCPRGMRAESSGALAQPGPPAHPPTIPAVQPLPAGCAGPYPAQPCGCRLPSTALAEHCSRCPGRRL